MEDENGALLRSRIDTAIRDTKEAVPAETLEALISLKEAMKSAKELLRFGIEGSNIYMVLERKLIMNKFHEVTAWLDQALSGISYDKLDISDEVKEQTYELSSIEKWLEEGHGTCPKTQQRLSNTVLTPNFVLRSLIAQCCEANGIEPPKQPSSSGLNKSASACSPAERNKIEINADNRVAIAEAGAIPLLVGLLSTPDSHTQEHAVTALLNLSICENNKGSNVSSGEFPGIVHVLKKVSMEAWENAAATLFSLSVADEHEVTIGSSGAIPPQVTLLSEGKVVRAGVVPTLMRLLTEPGGGMVDEALAILAILSSHSEGKAAIGSAEAVPVLVEVIGNGSPRNKENAAAVLVHLCSGGQQYLA
ncbi:RING-type E3 ubiquitin transferase [Quillaja saponaria]|uniref:RING-type E3 ubiquitin transferase n=1 Tax=Quillaja saponaria TaxID=32244 RepID=A0AAD7KXW4_QUISA|nr:RING-type E3 ubiquitin transferase [Quillaja saponaria]